MQNMPQQRDVFLSYNSRDSAAVEGIARKLTGMGLTVFLDRWYLTAGTPWPEHLESVLNSCRSAAVILGPNGIGKWQRREQYLALDRQARDPAFPVIPVLLPGAEPALGFLSLNTWIDLRDSLSERDWLQVLARAIRGLPPGPEFQYRSATVLSTICPYRGLRFFREEDAPFFFGRDALIERLASAVDQHSILAVVGASGSGKSSVVRAGLIPRLRKLRGTRVWDVATIVPGDRPLHNLAAVLVRLLEPDMSEVERLKQVGELAVAMEAGSISLRDAVSRALEKQPGTDRLMLVVDQWEELYTLTSNPSYRQRFLEEILEATATGPLSVAFTLRGDFFDQLLGYRPLSDRIQDAVVNVSRMTMEELVQVVERPAQKVGLRFEPGLVNRILNGVQGEPGSLPLLEFVLAELWNQREDEVLTHAAYETIGEIQGAIATRAETVYAGLSAAEQSLAQRVFLQLVRPGEPVNSSDPDTESEPTRRRTSFVELGPECLPVVRKLADAHLIVTGKNDATGEEFIDLVHEALIRAWTRLHRWINDDRQFLIWREQLRTLINISASRGARKQPLLRGHLLADAKLWLGNRERDLGPSEQRFIQASIRAARLQQMWMMTPFITGIILTLVIVVMVNDRAEKPRDSGSQAQEADTPQTFSSPPRPREVVARISRVEADSLTARIRQLAGITSLHMQRSPTIAIVGPAPLKGTLRDTETSVVSPPPEVSADELAVMQEFVSMLVRSVQVAAPSAKFAFIPTRMDASFDAGVLSGINELAAAGRRPAILLSAYNRWSGSSGSGAGFEAALSQGILVILSAPTRFPEAQGRIRSRERFLTVASVSLEGDSSKFSPQLDGLLWSPGENVPVEVDDAIVKNSGNGLAAALTAGIAARLLDQKPDLSPSQVMQILRASSRQQAPDGPPIVNLDAALARLSP